MTGIKCLQMCIFWLRLFFHKKTLCVVLKGSTDITSDCNIKISGQQNNYNQCSKENYLIFLLLSIRIVVYITADDNVTAVVHLPHIWLLHAPNIQCSQHNFVVQNTYITNTNCWGTKVTYSLIPSVHLKNVCFHCVHWSLFLKSSEYLET